MDSANHPGWVATVEAMDTRSSRIAPHIEPVELFSRRDFVTHAAFIGAGVALGPALGAAGSSEGAELDNQSGKGLAQGRNMKSIQFKNGAITMVGNLHLPEGFDTAGHYAAIVVVHPGGGVRNRRRAICAATRGARVCRAGVRRSHQGASGGEPRFLDDPMKRVGDIYSAVDYLTSLSYVDANRIGALGICAGSGAAIKAASTERRIKAVGTVSAVDVGAATRKGWDGKASEPDQIATLEAVAKQRTAEAAGAAPVYVNYVPKVGDKTAPRDLARGRRLLLHASRSASERPQQDAVDQPSYMVSFTGFDRVETC